MSTPPAPAQKSINIADLPAECLGTESLRKIRGVVVYPADQEAKLPNLKLLHHGGTRLVDISGVQITLGSIPRLKVWISDPQQTILIGKEIVGLWTLRMWGRSSVEIADGCTSNGTL